MKKRSVVLVLGLTMSVQAMTYLGPPTTDMRAGEWSVGASYGYSEQDVEVTETDPFTGEEFTYDVEEYELEMTFARFAVGLVTSRVEAFGMIGGVNDEGDTFHGHPEDAVGGGARITTNIDDPVRWGIVGQVVYLEPDDVSVLDAQIGIGPCWRPEPFIVYGGLLLHFLDIDVDENEFIEAEIEQDDWLGGYIGGGIEVWEHLQVTIEGQFTPGSAAGGLGLAWRF